MKNLDDVATCKELYRDLLAAVEKGNKLDMQGEHSLALDEYKLAWEMIPKPVEAWSESHWIASCFIETYLDMGDPVSAKSWCDILLKTKKSEVDSASIVTAGRVYFELGDMGGAYDFFRKAFELGKRRAFEGYDSKYLKFYLAQTAE